MTTKELLDRFFSEVYGGREHIYQNRLDNAKLYAYEAEIGKPLCQMNTAEVKELLFRLSNNDFGKGKVNIAYRTYAGTLVLMKGFFDWYIENVEVIRNPCNGKDLTASTNMAEFVDIDDLMTPEHMENAIRKIREERAEITADYWEAIIRMFYEGFPNALAITRCKTTDIDHELKTARLELVTIQLSHRLYELLKIINERDKMPFAKGYCALLSYHDSYFKFPVLKKRIEVYEELPETEFSGHITRVLNKDIRPYFDVTVNARILYYRGFYDWLCRKMGANEVKRIAAIDKDYIKSGVLSKFAREYGIVDKNVSSIKNALMPYTL